MAKSRALAVRLPVETWNHLNEEARRLGMTLSALARTKLMLTSEFEGPIQECIEDFSQRLSISRHEFLEAIVIDFMARFSSRRQSDRSGRHLPQFVYTDEGLLHGKDLFNYMLAYYEKEEQGLPLHAAAMPPGRPPVKNADRAGDRPESAVRTSDASDRPEPKETASDEDDAPALTQLERERIDKAMFDRIMQHYQDRGADEEPTDDQSES